VTAAVGADAGMAHAVLGRAAMLAVAAAPSFKNSRRDLFFMAALLNRNESHAENRTLRVNVCFNNSYTASPREFELAERNCQKSIKNGWNMKKASRKRNFS
jgi:hypothetical protein